MDKLEVLEKLSVLIENNFKIDDFYIEETTSLREELEMDSIDIIELSFFAENEFKIKIDDIEVENWNLIDDVISTIKKYIND